MRRILFILTLLTSVFAEASHLLGSEITYKYLYGKTYEINVILYRDCADCKLGGDGGGSSTSDCSDLEEIYARTVNSSCGNTTFATIALTKTGFSDITELCSGYASKCESNSTYSYGIEEHRYKGTINFNSYLAYSSCDVQLFLHKSERSLSITTLANEGADLYNYAMINPWGEGFDSPTFDETVQIIFNVNKPAYVNDGARSSQNDSLHFNLSNPQSAFKQNISYSGVFGPHVFVSAYCTSGSVCVPNPNASPPEGIYINPETGNIVFTPTSAGQIGTRVVEVEQWQNRNGTPVKIGVVRRDIIVIIENASTNNAPKITADLTYDACVGQNLNFEITATDALTTSTSSSDSVQFGIIKTLDSLQAIIQNTTMAPFQKVLCSFTPRAEHVGTHFIQVKATDNHCPKNASSYKVIKIVVHPKPVIDFFVDDLFCGNNEITLTSSTTGSFTMEIRDDSDELFDLDIQTGHVFTYYDSASLDYELNFISTKGCEALRAKSIINGGNSSVSDLVFSGSLHNCPNSILDVEASHLESNIEEINWTLNGDIIDNDTKLDVIAFDGKATVDYSLISNGFLCEKTDEISLTLKPVPSVDFTPEPSYCHSIGEIALNSLNPTLNGGDWSSLVKLNSDRIDLNQFPNADTSFALTYTLLDNASGCESVVSKTINVLNAPVIQLKDMVICGGNSPYSLNNIIALPYHSSPENITWSCTNLPSAVIGSHPNSKLDLPNIPKGTYTINATNTYPNGCSVNDEAWIRLDEGLTIEINDVESICQDDLAVNLDFLFEINAPGGNWINLGGSNGLEGREFTPSNCGQYHFQYVYDMNGCYDQKDISLDVICRPLIQMALPDSVCENSASINLPTNNLGYWQGAGVVDKKFFPANLSGKQSLTFTTNDIEGCVFDSTYSIEVLPPLSANAINLPLSLCEGDTLTLGFEKKPYLQHNITVCDKEITYNQNPFKYIPQLCDLTKRKIELSVLSTSNLACPIGSDQFEIPYYEKPAVQELESISDCWPYNLSLELNTVAGLNPTLSSVLSNAIDESSYAGKSIIESNINPGIYSLIVSSSDENGCSNEQSFPNIISIHHKPTSGFIMDKQERVTLSNRELFIANTSYIESGDMNHSWFVKSRGIEKLFSTKSSPIFELPPDTGVHVVTLISRSGKTCKDTASESILVVPDIIAFIPNAFSPDNKGPQENGTFSIISEHAQRFHIKIFNQYGQLVFESFDINNSWDGNFGGKQCQNGVYAYVIELVNKSGVTYNYEGAVTLLR